MKLEYREKYKNLYEQHWWWRARETLLIELLQAQLPAREAPRKIIDIGSGEGLFFAELNKIGKPSGYEPSLEHDLVTDFGTVYHRGLENAELFPDNSYDVSLLLDVIEHVDNDLQLVESAMRVTKGGGFIFITVPAYQALWTAHDDDNQHKRRYSVKALTDLAQAASLEVITIGALFGWAGLVKLTMATISKLTGQEFRGSSIPAQSLNRILQFVTILEGRLMIKVRSRLGSSLYLLAKVKK